MAPQPKMSMVKPFWLLDGLSSVLPCNSTGACRKMLLHTDLKAVGTALWPDYKNRRLPLTTLLSSPYWAQFSPTSV